MIEKYADEDNTANGNSGGVVLYIDKSLIGTVNIINIFLMWTGGYGGANPITIVSGGFKLNTGM